MSILFVGVCLASGGGVGDAAVLASASLAGVSSFWEACEASSLVAAELGSREGSTIGQMKPVRGVNSGLRVLKMSRDV